MANPRLPQKLLNHAVDLLHDAEYALKNCCRPIPQTMDPTYRKHFFASITSPSAKRLPDPSSSPGHHTRTLSVVIPSPSPGYLDHI